MAFFAPLGRWYDMRAFPTEEGLTIYMLDITEQYKAEETTHFEELFVRGNNVLFILPEAK